MRKELSFAHQIPCHLNGFRENTMIEFIRRTLGGTWIGDIWISA